MENSIFVLCLTAATIALVHTMIGPDHYLPFIVMSRAGHWSRTKTYIVTLLCGVGHVGSSIVIGLIGVGLGVAVGQLEAVEGARGGWAAWALIAFGLAYGAWGVTRAMKNKTHRHLHVHEDGSHHDHGHNHHQEHVHAHASTNRVLTPWILFTVFVLGPCEPLIPILMYPAATHS
ncbi:MAG: hypothetical protein O3A46_17050, partial [Candidatus Poribacteria bacterium]|nr:hypothetical protein [Candidatus Poribacteria bacterium]